jgi:replicative DNA helicase
MKHRLLIEAQVLGYLLRHPERFAELELAAEYFTPQYEPVFRSIKRLHDLNLKLDLMSVYADLMELGIDISLTELGDIFQSACGNGFVRKNVEAIVEYGRKANIASSAIDIASKALESELSSDQLSSMLLELSESSLGKTKTDVKSLADIMQTAMNEVKTRHEAGGDLPGLKIGIPDFDDKLGGLQPGCLYVLAGRPAMGKTAFAMDIANKASTVTTAAVFALEMGELQSGLRIMANLAGVHMGDLIRGRFTSDALQRLNHAMGKAATMSQHWCFSDNPSLGYMQSVCRRIQRQHGLGLIVVDYLQLMDGDGDNENRTQEISKISRGLKRLAKMFNVPVLALSQLSRACETRPDKQPQLSDLRESGSIEQDADAVIAMFRPCYYWPERPANFSAALILKNRQGETGTISMSCDLATQRFGIWTGGNVMDAAPKAKSHSAIFSYVAE